MDWQSAKSKDEGSIVIPARWLHLHYYEALNILFRMENALRVFVYVVLKKKFKDKWAETAIQTAEDEKSTIATAAAKRIAQAMGFGYLGYEIRSPLMYLNSGELVRLITSEAYWELFKPFFRGKKEMMKNKLDEIGIIRNALAHFRPLKYDDIELIKQNIKHTFVGIEQCLADMTQTNRVIPTNTNTEDEWYKNLITLGSNHCKVQLFQNSSEKWVRIEINYNSVILRGSNFGAGYRDFTVTKVLSPAIITKFSLLARCCTFVTENVLSSVYDDASKSQFIKVLSLVFDKHIILQHHAEINIQLKEILLKIENETELVQKDNLARGDLVDSSRIWSLIKTSEQHRWWSTTDSELRCEFGENDPPEYWGDIGLYVFDFIAGTNKYPWMPSNISRDEVVPF